MSKHKPWKVLASKSVYRFDPWLAVERQKIELSDGRVIDDGPGSRVATVVPASSFPHLAPEARV